jgi:hypothetical protein
MGWLPSNFHRRGFMGLVGSTTTALLACSCGKAFAQQPAEQGGAIPGGDKSAKSKMLGMGADMLQNHAPINAINMYLNGFHVYADDMGRQIEAHHYCHHLNEEFFQCVIYDGNKTDSRLIGIEYIVSERIFKTLPEDEKPLWHSHRHETTSGELVMPGIPMPVEHTAIATLVNTYGKTWHTWQIDRDSALPLGIPQLMMGFTEDGQLKPEMISGKVGVDRAGLLRSRREASGPTAAAFRTTDMRKILLSLVALYGMGTAGFAQDGGVYQPPGSAWPTAPGAGKSGNARKPTLGAPNYGPVDGAIQGTVGQDGVYSGSAPGAGKPTGGQGTKLPSDVSGNGNITGQSYGGQLYFSNGTTGTRYGDRTYFSDGTTGTTYGNKTYLSNGKVCQQYGGQLNCN